MVYEKTERERERERGRGRLEWSEEAKIHGDFWGVPSCEMKIYNSFILIQTLRQSVAAEIPTICFFF